MRAPRFWNRGCGGLAGPALAPAALVWTAATRWRLRHGAALKTGVPVICIGNLTVGGTGKTPTVLALVERLSAQGRRIAVVSRGYRGRLSGPVRVQPSRHTAADVGDEPLLMAAWGPVWVGRDRKAAAQAAAAEGAEVIVMDDGFQNAQIGKDLSLVVVDGETGFGNGRVLPAGPLREPVRDGLGRADFVLVVGDSREFLAHWPEAGSRPLLHGRLEPLPTGMPWAGLRVLAFAGIGRPDKFFATLRELGAEIAQTRSFGDHEGYTRAILDRLEMEARSLGAQLVTTEKDAVRLPDTFRRRVLVLPVRMMLETWEPLDRAIARLFGDDLRE